MNLSEGTEAVRFARAAAEAEVLGGGVCAPRTGAFSEPSGAFVTLNAFPGHALRGCIGYPMPVFPLGEAIERSARGACHDPRFPGLRADELDSVTFEVTVLTPPVAIRGHPEEIRDAIEVGKDGLILELMGHRGLLLPQVPGEFGWDAARFLESLSRKAGLPQDAWMHPDARISRFQGRIFHEEAPRGDVSEVSRCT